ncbi:MAG: type II toxin-antitoxin system VapC family toxin, partial [Thaumarchaeota archaeon]|nr:type II toxin-antitoxin system VapC family toxin [Nitrososphaerota archaeon]
MIYLDANFFVFCNMDWTERGERARILVQKMIDGAQEAVTSALTLDEVMWVVMKSEMNKELRRIIEGIYAINNLRITEVGPEIPLMALDMMEAYGLKPRDAFHAAIMK